MKLVSKGNDCTIKLEDKNSGELFAKCPIEQYPGIAIESVADSSRYFVLRLQDDNGVFLQITFLMKKLKIFNTVLGRSAFIGIGFTDRSDSFDLNVALQDHFKRLQTDQAIEKEKEEPKQQLDLSFKEGETIKINMKITVSIRDVMIFFCINSK
jgi:adaptin ear-binding coat-associated protein 1/2